MFCFYIGDGYSIYILDDEWVYQAGTMGGRNVDIWKPILSENEDTELRIVKMGGNGFSEAQAWVREQYPDYRLYEDKRRGLGGVDLPYPKSTLDFDASFCFLGEDLYAVISIQPFKYYDRFMYPLRAMIETIQPFFYFPTAGELGRPEHTQMSYRAGGEEIVSEASLYVGNSYSIYLPDEGWTRQTDIVENDTVGAWKSTLHDGVELRIENRGHYIDWVRKRNPGYVFTEEENGEITGENMEGFRMEVRQISKTIHGKTAEYTIYKVYPVVDTEESERIKAMLDAMTDTFEPFENAVHYSLLF